MVTLSTCMFSWCKNICLDNLATASFVTKYVEFISEYQNDDYEKIPKYISGLALYKKIVRYSNDVLKLQKLSLHKLMIN